MRIGELTHTGQPYFSHDHVMKGGVAQGPINEENAFGELAGCEPEFTV